MGQIQRKNEWFEYYEHFKYFSKELVRDGSHPQIFLHPEKALKSIVLVHGLTDSPHFMRSIAKYFHKQLGYNVYLPLLRGHGLKNPKGMIGVRLKDWLANVNFAIECAQKHASIVSIGGLSAGGALSFYTAATNYKITGSVYLFSAALDIAGGTGGILGEVAERLLRTPVAKLMYRLDRKKPLINANPFKYARMDKGGAIQLSRLIKKTDHIIIEYKNKKLIFPKRIFAAHSESDTAAHIDGILALREIADPKQFTLFTVSNGVSHAGLVLQKNIYPVDGAPTDEPLVKANPGFNEMMDALSAFEHIENREVVALK